MVAISASFWLLSTDRPADGAIVEYTDGHADIGLALEGGNELFLHYHFGVGAVLDGVSINPDEEFEPEDAYVRVADSTKSTIPNLPQFSFLGTAGGDVWVLPQSQRSGVPFLGLAAEELNAAVFSSAMLSFSSFSGPGDFSLWSSDSFGNPVLRLDTSNGSINLSFDEVSIGIGSHDHYNWGFTAAGIYNIGFEASAVHSTLGTLTDSGVFTFAVGNATAVPEPGSLLLLGAGAMGLFGGIRRRFRRPCGSQKA